MKALLLFANTSIHDLEEAIDGAVEKLSEDTDKAMRTDLIVGLDSQRLAAMDFVICIGIPVWETNRDFFGEQTVVCLVGDPMNLGALHGKRVIPVDYVVKKDMYGYQLFRRSVKEIRSLLTSTYLKKPKADKVRVLGLDMVPKMLSAIPDRTTFVPKLSAVIYSVREEDVRDSIRTSFMEWVVGTDQPDALSETLVEVMQHKRPSKRTVDLASIFETNDGQKARRAVKMVIEMISRNENVEKPRAIKYDAISATHSISQFDLKYMAYMARRNMRLTSHVWTEFLHKQEHDERYEKYLEEPEDANGEQEQPE